MNIQDQLWYSWLRGEDILETGEKGWLYQQAGPSPEHKETTVFHIPWMYSFVSFGNSSQSCAHEHLAMWLLLSLPQPQVQIQHDYFCCATQQAKFPLSLIVILKQFIIKYEHFLQGQLHFTKNQNHTTKIAGVWFTTWITVWNHAYISLKFTIKKKIHSGLAVPSLKL